MKSLTRAGRLPECLVPFDIAARDSLTRRSFLAQRLILGIALLTLGGAAGFNTYLETGRTERREMGRLLTQGHVVQENAIVNLSTTNQVLAALRQDLPAGKIDPNLNQRLGTLADAMPGVRTLAILDTGGVIRAANRPELLGRNFSQRAYFEAPRRHPDADMLFVSPPFRTSLGVYTLDVSRMIPGPRGEFAGVVTAVLDPQYFAPLLDSVRYAPDMRAAIVHGDGVVFVMAPHRVGRTESALKRPDSFFMRHLASRRTLSVFSRIKDASGTARMLAIRTVQPAELKMDKPLLVVMSRKLKEVYARRNRDIAIQGGLYGLIALVSVLGLYAYQRRQWQFNRQLILDAEALAASERRFRTVADYTYDWEYWEGPAQQILYMSPSCERITGYTRAEFAADPGLLLRIIHPEDRARMAAHRHDIENHDAAGAVDFRIVRRDGEVRWIAHACVAVYDPDGQYNGRRVSNRELTERKTAEESIRHLAQHDLLTKLPNRVLLFDRLQQALALARRDKADHPRLALMFLDLDKFKPINDTLGHAVGDLMLKAVAERMKACVRESDTVARVGGDEFVVLLPSIETPQDAALVAEKIRHALEQPFILDGHRLEISASIGVALYPEDGSDQTQLLKNADDAMYSAKDSGRNTVQFYRPASPPVETKQT